MNRMAVINEIIRKKGRTTAYVEIGVRNGKCFFNITARYRMAVDPDFRIGKRTYLKAYSRNPLQWFRDSFHSQTSDDFFRTYKNELLRKKPDVIFIDGLHTYEQSYRDVGHSLEVLNAGGVIVMHDCNPTTEIAAMPAFSPVEVATMYPEAWRGVWAGDVWKTIVRLRCEPGLEVFVLDADFGLGIVRKKEGAQPVLTLTAEDIGNMHYGDLADNREELLDLRSPDYLKDFLESV